MIRVEIQTVQVFGTDGERTSDLLFEGSDEEDSLLENAELRLWFVRLQSHRNHATELFKRLVYVAHSHPVHRIHISVILSSSFGVSSMLVIFVC